MAFNGPLAYSGQAVRQKPRVMPLNSQTRRVYRDAPGFADLAQNASVIFGDTSAASVDAYMDAHGDGVVSGNDTTDTSLVYETIRPETFPPITTGHYAHSSTHVPLPDPLYNYGYPQIPSLDAVPPTWSTLLQPATHGNVVSALHHDAGCTDMYMYMHMQMETDLGWLQGGSQTRLQEADTIPASHPHPHQLVAPNFQESQPYLGSTMNVTTLASQLPYDPMEWSAHQQLEKNPEDVVAITVETLSNELGTQASKKYTFIPEDGHSDPSKKRKRENVPNIDDPHKTSQQQLKDADGNIQGMNMILGSSRGFRKPSSRGKKATTRACKSCRHLKKKCIPNPSFYLPCFRCCTARPYKEILRNPCYRYKIEEIKCFRQRHPLKGPLAQTQGRIHELYIHQNSEESWAVPITQGFGPGLEVYISRFTSIPGTDGVSYRWKDGDKKMHEMEMPPYCIASLDHTKDNILQYIREFGPGYLELLVNTGLTQRVFDMALKHALLNKGSMVADALDIWFACRMIEEGWEVCESDAEKFDMSPVSEDGNPWNGKIPVTPMMDTQLDQIIIQSFLIPLLLCLLPKLEEKIWAINPQDWFEVFLTSFILLANVENIGRHAERFRIRHGVLKEGCIPRGMATFFHGAQILLGHFHGSYKGWAPFWDDWENPDTAKKRNMNEEQAKFMQNLQREIERKEEAMKEMRDQKVHTYKQPMYWCHQLFFKNWKPDS